MRGLRAITVNSHRNAATKKYPVDEVSKNPWKKATVPKASAQTNRTICTMLSTTLIGLKRNATSNPIRAGITKNKTNMFSFACRVALDRLCV